MAWIQLGIFDFVRPAAPPPKPQEYTIARNPYAGFKVVLAPGLTTTGPKNPCLSCSNFGEDMDACAEKCRFESARQQYLESVGAALVSSVCQVEGSYGFCV